MSCSIAKATQYADWKPRHKYMKYREGKIAPEMVVITHNHQDHAEYANQYEMICDVHKWQPKAESKNFKATGFKVEHGQVLNYAYLAIKAERRITFFATDLEYEEESISKIIDAVKGKVQKFLIECNYNVIFIIQLTKEKRIGCDRHFSDNG